MMTSSIAVFYVTALTYFSRFAQQLPDTAINLYLKQIADAFNDKGGRGCWRSKRTHTQSIRLEFPETRWSTSRRSRSVQFPGPRRPGEFD
jgi:hypothetical protein